MRSLAMTFGSARVALLFLSVAASSASAQTPLPFSDQPVRYDAKADCLIVARVGLTQSSDARLSAAKRAARRRALHRAQAALHAYVDLVLAKRGVSANLATRAHQALTHDQAAARQRVRPLVDGSAVVVLRVDVAGLRDVINDPGVPWAR